jgi:hypothetical protein
VIVAFYSQSSYAGKDTCADAAAQWCRENGITCQRDAFAWDGKVVCADALGIEGTRETKIAAVDRLKHEGTVTVDLDATADGPGHRSITQPGRSFIIGLLGDPEAKTGIRGLNEKFWTDQVLRRDRALQRQGGGFTIVSDLRFVEEAESVWENDGVIVEVVRPGAPVFNEQRVSYVSHVIRNDLTLDALRERARDVMAKINTESLVG